MFSDEAFATVRDRIAPKTEATHFFDCLETCRNLIKRNADGSNILRYLLHHMTNRVIKKQYKENWRRNYQEDRWEYIGGNPKLSNHYLANECIPFDTMPFCSGLKNDAPSLSDLFECLDAKDREHEILAWIIKNNTEKQGILFTPLEKSEDSLPLLSTSIFPFMIESLYFLLKYLFVVLFCPSFSLPIKSITRK